MRSIVVANWKMNPASFADARKLLDATRGAAESAKKVSVIVAPPSLYLRELRARYKGKRLTFAAQNAHFAKGGAFTGEVSMQEIRDARATHVIIGHAERRAMGETNEDVKEKIIAALDEKLIPILCIGETTRSSNGEHFEFVRKQLSSALRDLAPAKLSKVLMAYEPVWAIGATRPMSPRDMHEMAIFIRKQIVDMHGEIGMNMKILYGGSIDETNAGEMLMHGDVDGLLVGRASTDARKFAALLDALNTI